MPSGTNMASPDTARTLTPRVSSWSPTKSSEPYEADGERRPSTRDRRNEMAKLYGSMQGARAAGLVGHKEMTAQILTGTAAKQTGMLRAYVDDNGDYFVYLA